MIRKSTGRTSLKAVKKLGIPFNGTYQCPNRINHKSRLVKK
jgi:hypothetical protein